MILGFFHKSEAMTDRAKAFCKVLSNSWAYNYLKNIMNNPRLN